MKKFASILSLVVACLLLVPKLLIADDVSDNSNPALWGSLPLFTQNVPTVGSNSPTTGASKFFVPPGYAFVIFPSISSTQASTSNLVFKFKASVDGNTWTSNYVYTGTIALSGTTTNVTPIVITTNAEARYLSLDSITSTEVAWARVQRVQYLFRKY